MASAYDLINDTNEAEEGYKGYSVIPAEKVDQFKIEVVLFCVSWRLKTEVILCLVCLHKSFWFVVWWKPLA